MKTKATDVRLTSLTDRQYRKLYENRAIAVGFIVGLVVLLAEAITIVVFASTTINFDYGAWNTAGLFAAIFCGVITGLIVYAHGMWWKHAWEEANDHIR